MKTKNRHIMIVGGCGGMGIHIAQKLLNESTNLSLTTLPNTVCDKFKSTKNVSIIEADVTKESDDKNQFKKAIKKFGKIDHLIITVGVSHLGKLLDVGREEWDIIMNTNVWGILRTIQESVHYLKKGAKIVVIGSDVGFKPSHDIPLYSISKIALHSIITLLSQELPKFNISISGIAPYNTPPGMKRVFSKRKDKLICEPEDCNTPDWGNLPPTGRFIDVNTIANTVNFLLDSSNDYNGTIIPITGGYGMTIS